MSFKYGPLDLDNIAEEETFCMAPMVAINDGGDLDFYHVGGVLRMSLNGVLPNVKKIRVTFTGMTYVTGVYTVSNPGTSSSTIMVSSGSHNYVEFTKSDDFPVNFWLNIPLPSGNYTACTGMTIGLYDSSSSLINSKIFEFPWLSIGRARGKKEDIAIAIDLSCINTITRNQQARETANCYVVTEPGDYYLPLFYGNSIQNGANRLSTVAPSSYFWNSYGDRIANSNIITDITNYGYNASGGKLVWSTSSTNNTALVEVEPTIAFYDNVGYLFFSVPSSGFQEGSALIGVLKANSTSAYIWTWHIWITDGVVLDYNTYTNYAGTQINFLNRPLGGRGGVSRVCTYYQWGFPYPIPPSDGVNDAFCDLYTSEGSFTLSINNAASGYKYYNSISRPDYPNFSSYLYGSYATTQYNMWDATQASYTDKKVVKTVYDPCPPGFSVPRGDSFTGFTTSGGNTNNSTYINKTGNFEYGWWMYRNYTDKSLTFFWPACGWVRGSQPGAVGTSIFYWTAAPYASSSSTSSPFGRVVSGGSTSMNVANTTAYSRYYALPVCPALIEN